MKPHDQMLTDALQKRDIEELRREMKEGFTGIHQRQDTANGKLLKTEAEVNALKDWRTQRSVERKYEKLIWYLFTIAVAIIVAMGSSIIYNKKTPQATTITIPKP